MSVFRRWKPRYRIAAKVIRKFVEIRLKMFNTNTCDVHNEVVLQDEYHVACYANF